MKRIVLNVEAKEHADIKAAAKKAGFDTVAAYVKYLIRKDMK